MTRSISPVRNVLKAWLLLAGLAGSLAFVGWELGGVRLASIFAFCALLLAGAAWWSAERVAMGMVGARELLPGEAPALHSTVERLAARARVVKPKLYVLPEGPPLARAAGRGPSSSSLAVSTSLMALPAPAEIDGVIAHELAHVRNRDVLVQTTVVVVAAVLVESSRIGGWLQRALLFVLAPVAAAFVHLLLSPNREFEADRLAAEICESPHGLADALILLEQAAELVEFRGSPATEPLYTINPFEEEGIAALFVSAPPAGERVRRLRDLDPAWREKLRAA